MFFAIHLKQEELNNLETIKQKFIEASKKYLLEKDQESIQKVINKLASKLNKKSNLKRLLYLSNSEF